MQHITGGGGFAGEFFFYFFCDVLEVYLSLKMTPDISTMIMVFKFYNWKSIKNTYCFVYDPKAKYYRDKIWSCSDQKEPRGALPCRLRRMCLWKDPLFLTGLYTMTPYLKATDYLLLDATFFLKCPILIDPLFISKTCIQWSPFLFQRHVPNDVSNDPIFTSKAWTQWPPFYFKRHCIKRQH